MKASKPKTRKRKRVTYYYKILRDPRFAAIRDAKLRKYLRLRAQGKGEVSAANECGVTQDVVERWRREVPDVAELERDIEIAKDEFVERLLLECVRMQRAEAIKFYLQNRRPDVWGRSDTNVRVDVTLRQRLHAAQSWQEMLQDAREAYEALQAYAQATRQSLPAPGDTVPAAKALQHYRIRAIRKAYARKAAQSQNAAQNDAQQAPHQPPQPVRRDDDDGREPSGGMINNRVTNSVEGEADIGGDKRMEHNNGNKGV